MKYEMIFGDEKLFDGAGLFTGIDVVTRNIDDGLYRTSILSECTPSSLRINPIVAMRCIIKEPKRWTRGDKKAGVLPDVGAKCNHCHSTDGRSVISVTDKYVGIERDNYEMNPYFVTHAEFIKYYIPIETPAKKAQRERDEWAKKVSQFIDDELDCVNLVGEHVMRRFYNAMLSGDLPVPVKDAKNEY